MLYRSKCRNTKMPEFTFKHYTEVLFQVKLLQCLLRPEFSQKNEFIKWKKIQFSILLLDKNTDHYFINCSHKRKREVSFRKKTHKLSLFRETTHHLSGRKILCMICVMALIFSRTSKNSLHWWKWLKNTKIFNDFVLFSNDTNL